MYILEFLKMVIFEINFTTPVILKVLIKDIPMKLSVFQVLLPLYIINCFSRPNASTEIDTYENNSVWFFLDHPVIIFRYSIILWLWYCTIKLILSSTSWLSSSNKTREGKFFVQIGKLFLSFGNSITRNRSILVMSLVGNSRLFFFGVRGLRESVTACIIERVEKHSGISFPSYSYSPVLIYFPFSLACSIFSILNLILFLEMDSFLFHR